MSTRDRNDLKRPEQEGTAAAAQSVKSPMGLNWRERKSSGEDSLAEFDEAAASAFRVICIDSGIG